MALLFGSIGNSPSIAFSSRLETLADTLNWEEAEFYPVNYGGFCAGLYVNPLFKKDLDDYIRISDSERIVVLLDGHIYNLNELRLLAGCEEPNVRLPELVLLLFKKFGKSFVNLLNGDFVILIYQGNDKTLLIYRDHLGIMPLSYAVERNQIWFANDGFTLCKALYGNEQVQPDFLINFLKRTDEIDMTLLPNRKVKKLLPGHCLEIDTRLKARLVRYWFPERIREDSSIPFKVATDELKQILLDAVQIRIDRKLKTGAHLSGGLDSGIVAAFTRNQLDEASPFYGFSWSPGPDELPVSDDGEDERVAVSETYRKCGITPVFPDYGKDTFEETYFNWRTIRDSYREIAVRKMARKLDVNLLFSGWGGDEFISINDRGVDSDLFFKLKWNLFFRRYPLNKPVHFFKKFILIVVFPFLGFTREMFDLKVEGYRRYLKKRGVLPNFRFNPLSRWRSRREVHLRLLENCHLSERTENWYNNGYRNGIEYRYPLLDKRIVEYVLKLPSTVMYWDKYVRVLLREISKGILPDSVVYIQTKDNPAIVQKSDPIIKEVFREAVLQFDEIKSNPDLGFANFKLLEKEIREVTDDQAGNLKCAGFLVGLKILHEFTKGYYK